MLSLCSVGLGVSWKLFKKYIVHDFQVFKYNSKAFIFLLSTGDNFELEMKGGKLCLVARLWSDKGWVAPYYE